MHIEKKDPKTFWNIINKMNKWGKEKTDPADSISPKRWGEHFTKLLNTAKESKTNTLKAGNTFEPI